jgi:hypothetical protein
MDIRISLISPSRRCVTAILNLLKPIRGGTDGSQLSFMGLPPEPVYRRL